MKFQQVTQALLAKIIANPEPSISQASNHGANDQLLPPSVTVKSRKKRIYVAPRISCELQLKNLWEEVLEIHPIGITENFFELGGHSEQASRLLRKIEQKFGKTLPITTLLQAPTVEQLASLISQEEDSQPWASLVPIQPHGSRPPFFCIHALLGNVLKFSKLGDYLGTDQPLYGLQAKGINGKQAPFYRFEDMAAHYIKEIRTLQPEGPYYLGGYSLGGDIAFEMAQQLHSQGQKVGLLVMFDSFGRGSFPRLTFREQHYLAYLLKLGCSRTLLSEVKDLLIRKYQMIRAKLLLSRGLPLPHKLLSEFIPEVHMQAARSYVPQVYPGQVTLLRASQPSTFYKRQDMSRPEDWYDRDPEHGWGKAAGGGLVIHDVPGHHHSMFEEPNIQVVTEKLQACLDEAQSNYAAAAFPS